MDQFENASFLPTEPTGQGRALKNTSPFEKEEVPPVLLELKSPKPKVLIQFETVHGKELYSVCWARRQESLVVNALTPVFSVIQKLTVLLALLLQNLMQVLERPFRKDVGSKENSDLGAALSTLDASGTIISLQAFTDTEYKLVKKCYYILKIH